MHSKALCTFFLAAALTGCSSTALDPETTDHVHQKNGKTMHREHTLGGEVTIKTPALQRMYEFHGHLGPYVVLGYRAGRLAREQLGSPGYFDLTAAATCPLHPPPSCFLDGIQLGAGCTAGKRNFSAEEGEPISCLFTSKQGGSVRLTLTEGLPEKIRAWIEAEGVETTGRKVFELPPESLFTVEKL